MEKLCGWKEIKTIIKGLIGWEQASMISDIKYNTALGKPMNYWITYDSTGRTVTWDGLGGEFRPELRKAAIDWSKREVVREYLRAKHLLPEMEPFEPPFKITFWKNIPYSTPYCIEKISEEPLPVELEKIP